MTSPFVWVRSFFSWIARGFRPELPELASLHGSETPLPRLPAAYLAVDTELVCVRAETSEPENDLYALEEDILRAVEHVARMRRGDEDEAHRAITLPHIDEEAIRLCREGRDGSDATKRVDAAALEKAIRARENERITTPAPISAPL